MWNRRAVLRGWVFGIVVLTLILFSRGWRFDWRMLWVPVIATAYSGVGAIVGWMIYSHAARRNFRQARALWHPTSVRWDDDSIQIMSERGKVRDNWSNFFAWAANDQFILLYHTAASFVTIPVRDLNSDARTEIVSALTNAGVAERASR